MNNKIFLRFIQNSIFLIVFNAVFFIGGGIDHKASVWISYAFIHFAYFMLLLVPILVRGGKSEAVLGFSLHSVSLTYFFVEFFTGLVFILLSLDSYKAALLVQLCIAGLYGIAMTTNMIAGESAADAVEKRQHQIEFVKNASAKLNGLLGQIDDRQVKEKVGRAYEAIDLSPVKSHPDLTQKESSIKEDIQKLEEAVSCGDRETIMALADSLVNAINERNRTLKTYN